MSIKLISTFLVIYPVLYDLSDNDSDVEPNGENLNIWNRQVDNLTLTFVLSIFKVKMPIIRPFPSSTVSCFKTCLFIICFMYALYVIFVSHITFLRSGIHLHPLLT